MAIRSDSWGSVSEVAALARFALRGDAAFGASTTPTDAQVEKFIDRASGVLNVALREYGFAPSDVSNNSTATLMMDDWVVSKAVAMVELVQPGAAFEETDMSSNIAGLHDDACKFVSRVSLGLKREGVTVSDASSQGLDFTGLSKHDERSDPDSDTREQPLFRRRQFDI